MQLILYQMQIIICSTQIIIRTMQEDRDQETLPFRASVTKLEIFIFIL